MNTTEIKVRFRDPFPLIKETVDEAVNLIKPTYGPAGNKVLISKITHLIAVDDGVQIARDLEFPDIQKNGIWRIVRETAVKTNDRVGDGTTGALIMVQAMIEEVSSMARWDGHTIERELRSGLEDATSQLRKMSKQVSSKEDLKKVARISFDNEEIAEKISDIWHKVGKDGVVTVDSSVGFETTAELTDGLTLARGYISPYMVTNPQRMESVVEKPYILITDYRLTEAADVLPIMDKLLNKEIRNLVIIAENIEQSALATLIVNRIQGKFNALAITVPSSENMTVYLNDLAAITGAKFFSKDKGDDVREANIEDLGRSQRFIARKESSVIVSPGAKKSEMQVNIQQLKSAIENEQDPREKKSLEKRLGFFTGKIAVIKVGAPTENEQRALKYKVEDAVNAVRAAYRGGVVSGAGLALARLKTSSPILNRALKYPFRQLLKNMGMEAEIPKNPSDAINVRTGKVGNHLAIGVIDPVDVLIAGIESAVSITSILVTLSGMIVEAPRKPKIVEEEE